MNARKTVVLSLVVLAAIAASEAAADPLREVFSEKATKTRPLDPGGVVFIESFAGSITVQGGDVDKLIVEATRTIKAAPGVDITRIKEGLGVRFEGTAAKQTVKSVGILNSRIVSTRIDYDVKIPAGASVNLIAGVGDAFSVTGVNGRVYVRNVSGKIIIERVTGPVFVDSVNAAVILRYQSPPTSGGEIKTTNGSVEVRVPSSSRLKWVAKTLKGDIMTGGLDSFAGQLIDSGGQKTYRAVLNGGEGPQFFATSVTGRLYLMPTEKPRALAASVLPATQAGPQNDDLSKDYPQIVSSLLIQPPTARTFFIQKARQEGNLELNVGLGLNVFYVQIDGDASVRSNGGEVVLGRVGGACTVDSKGGGVNLGDVVGTVDAATAAGDVFVRMARSGGRITTGGGSIHVLYAGEAMTLESGGGDLTVRQAAGGLTARTQSGDIVVTTDPRSSGAAPIALTTQGGNIVFEVPSSRGFDIDAEIEADAASADRIESAFAGLTMVREKSGNRVKIRARGKINGGGAAVTLRAKGGNIVIGRVPENRVVFVQ